MRKFTRIQLLMWSIDHKKAAQPNTLKMDLIWNKRMMWAAN